MSAKALARRGREAREWLMEACFPLWAGRGTQGCGFLEALDLQHKPIETPIARVRVQARQTYVFATAHQMGWRPQQAADLVHLGMDVMEQVCRRADGLFARQLDLTESKLTDDAGDLYDSAFGVYALSSVLQMGSKSGDKALFGRALALTEETIAAIETQLIDPSGGYIESLPRPEYRMQNPHMHLFEASLAQLIATEAESHRARADALYQLCRQHFIHKETGTLSEFFQQGSWDIPAGAKGETVEPGHQFEWVWLLSEYARLAGMDMPDIAHGLYRFSCQTLDEEGRASQSCLRDGTPVDASRRTWPQTEALKAHMAMWRAGDKEAAARAVTSFDILMDEYLTPEGGWIDHYEADGLVRARNMPASTGYHVVLALLDLINTVEA